jgi:hypothetical protein
MAKTATIALAIAGLFTVYFPAALWLKYSYEPPKGPPGSVRRLIYFQEFGGHGFMSYAQSLHDLADEPGAPERSPIIIYEDGKPLGPAHTRHADIAALGHGRLSHWGQLVIFSTSDNSDPRSNGREYWAGFPHP